MNKGVEILLARMESNPEEFNGEINRWGDLLQYYKTYLNPDDANALNEGINKTIQQRFTEKVMEELLDPKSETNPYLAPSATHLGGATPVRSSVALNNINTVGTWGDSSIQQTLARLEEIKKEYDKPKKEKFKTIFGRLFNYQ
jgi:hypothetical protein